MAIATECADGVQEAVSALVEAAAASPRSYSVEDLLEMLEDRAIHESSGPGERTFRVPADVRAAARRGTELRERFGRGGTEVGAARARQLAGDETIGAGTVKAMYAYFARHKVDKAGRNWDSEESPSAGKIAWLLWGGDPAERWVNGIRPTL